MAAVTAMVVGMGVTAAASAYSAKKQGDAAKTAGEQSAAANRDALEFEREQADIDRQRAEEADRYNRAKAEEQEREDKRRYEIEMQLDQQRYGESIARARAADEFERQRYTERRGDMAPYRAQGVQALQQLGALANIHIAPSGAPEQPPASAATMAQLADMRAGR